MADNGEVRIEQVKADPEKPRYLLGIVLTTEEPLKNVSLMSIAGAVQEQVGSGARVQNIDMKRVDTRETP